MQLTRDVGVIPMGKGDRLSHRHATWDAVHTPLCQKKAVISLGFPL